MSYATLRLVHQGFRVIRVEPAPPLPAEGRAATPTGTSAAKWPAPMRRSCFVAPNVGKEALSALNLKHAEGRALLLLTGARTSRRRRLHQHTALASRRAGHRLRNALRGATRTGLVLHLGDGTGRAGRAGLRPNAASPLRLYRPHRKQRRPATAVRPAAHRPQGRRRSVSPGDARPRRTRPHRLRPANGKSTIRKCRRRNSRSPKWVGVPTIRTR